VQRWAGAKGRAVEFEREWLELLNEVRVVVPGVQLLFGLLLAAPLVAHGGRRASPRPRHPHRGRRVACSC
jgi:hypothetical protein